MKLHVEFSPRKTLLMLAALMLTGGLYAQKFEKMKHPLPPDSAQIVEMVEHLTQELSLDKEQNAVISALHFDHFKEVRIAFERHEAELEKNHQLMESKKREFEESIIAQLNDEQKKKFEEMRKNQKPLRIEDRGSRPKDRVNPIK